MTARLRSVVVVVCLSLTVACQGFNLGGHVKDDGDKITEWDLTVENTGKPDQRSTLVARAVPTVSMTAETAGLGSNVSEVFSLAQDETLQSFDVSQEAAAVVYSKVSSAPNGQMRTEIFLRKIGSNTPENIVPSAANAIYLDPTVQGDELYYVSTAYGGHSLMRVPLTESMPTQLTDPKGQARSPRVARGQVVYVDEASAGTRGDISVVPAAGGPRRVFGSGSQPVWTSDGSSLVYVDNSVIYKVAADGSGHPVQVYSCDSSLQIKDPALSPDDKMVAFAAKTTGIAGDYDIYVLELGTNQPQHVTALGSLDDMPRWLDNRKLLFRSTRGKRWGIWLVELPPSIGTKANPEP